MGNSVEGHSLLCQETEGFNEEQLACILDLDYENHLQLQALACVCFTCFTGIRIEDLHRATTTDLTRTPSPSKPALQH